MDIDEGRYFDELINGMNGNSRSDGGDSRAQKTSKAKSAESSNRGTYRMETTRLIGARIKSTRKIEFDVNVTVTRWDRMRLKTR